MEVLEENKTTLIVVGALSGAFLLFQSIGVSLYTILIPCYPYSLTTLPTLYTTINTNLPSGLRKLGVGALNLYRSVRLSYMFYVQGMSEQDEVQQRVVSGQAWEVSKPSQTNGGECRIGATTSKQQGQPWWPQDAPPTPSRKQKATDT